MTNSDAQLLLNRFDLKAIQWSVLDRATYCAWCGYALVITGQIVTYQNGLSTHGYCAEEHDDAVAAVQFNGDANQ